MKKLDLHGKSYEESEQLVSIFIENNIDALPIEIINISDKTTAPQINFKKTPDAGKNKTNYIFQNLI